MNMIVLSNVTLKGKHIVKAGMWEVRSTNRKIAITEAINLNFCGAFEGLASDLVIFKNGERYYG